MKKLLTISICFFYIVSSMGVTMKSHYCMGRLASLSFQVPKPDSKCPKCGTKNKRKGCCEDKSMTFKLQDDQQISSSTLDFAAQYLVAIAPTYCCCSPRFYSFFLSDVRLPLGHAPPYLRKVSLHLFHCILLN